MATSEQPRLLTQQDGRVLTVTFNNSPRHFLDYRMAIELDDLTRKLSEDKTIGAVILTGTDHTYITHLDVPSLLHAAEALPFSLPYPAARVVATASSAATRSRTVQRVLQRTRVREFAFAARLHAAMRRMNTMDKVFITAINGLALGGGCLFALACDIRVAASDVQIGLPESGLGMLAASGGTQRLRRMVGAGRALAMLLDGEFLTADAAHQCGLLHDVVARSDLQQEAATLAHRLASRSPVVVREIKRMIYAAGDRRFPLGLRMEYASLLTTITSREARRNIRSYRDWLAAHPDPSDDVIESGFKALLAVSGSSPRGPGSGP